jgi:hypothetical protein
VIEPALPALVGADPVEISKARLQRELQLIDGLVGVTQAGMTARDAVLHLTGQGRVPFLLAIGDAEVCDLLVGGEGFGVVAGLQVRLCQPVPVVPVDRVDIGHVPPQHRGIGPLAAAGTGLGPGQGSQV